MQHDYGKYPDTTFLGPRAQPPSPQPREGIGRPPGFPGGLPGMPPGLPGHLAGLPGGLPGLQGPPQPALRFVIHSIHSTHI